MAYLPTAVPDENAFTAGASPVLVPESAVFNDALAALTSGQQGAGRQTPNRARHVNLRNQSGTEIGTAANPVRTDPTGTTKQPVLLYDAAGNAITSTSGALDVNIASPSPLPVLDSIANAHLMLIEGATSTLANTTSGGKQLSRGYATYSGDVVAPRFVGNRSVITQIINPATNTQVALFTAPAYFFVESVLICVNTQSTAVTPGNAFLYVFDNVNTGSTVLGICSVYVPTTAPVTGQTVFIFRPKYNSVASGNTLYFRVDFTTSFPVTGTFFCVVNYALTANTW